MLKSWATNSIYNFGLVFEALTTDILGKMLQFDLGGGVNTFDPQLFIPEEPRWNWETPLRKRRSLTEWSKQVYGLCTKMKDLLYTVVYRFFRGVQEILTAPPPGCIYDNVKNNDC